jgi:hypothetical protein
VQLLIADVCIWQVTAFVDHSWQDVAEGGVGRRTATVLYLIILFNLTVPTLLIPVDGPLLGNGCGSPNHV